MIQRHLDRHSMAALIGAAACWGIATVLTKALLHAIPPLLLLSIQLTTSTLLLWLLLLVQGHHRFQWRGLWGIGLLGLLNPGISYSLSLLGLAHTTASMSTLLWASEPVLILLLAWLLLREQLSPRLWVLALVAMVGVTLAGGLGTGDVQTGQFQGNLLISGGVLCCAFYTILAQRTRAVTTPLIAVTLQQSVALLWALLLLPIEIGWNGMEGWGEITMVTWLWAALSGVIYYALAFWLYLRGLAHVPASLAGIFINLIPIFGIGTAAIFLRERLTAGQWLGAMLILVAVFLILWYQHQQSRHQSKRPPRLVEPGVNRARAGSAFLEE